MQLSDILQKESINIDIKAKDKKDVLKELVKTLSDYPAENERKVMKVLLERENLGSTGIGQGIAIPHGKLDNIDKIYVALGISKEGIDFNSLDGEPVYIFFLLLAPKKAAGPHLKALARISKILRDPSFCNILRKANDIETVYRLLIKEDEKKQ